MSQISLVDFAVAFLGIGRAEAETGFRRLEESLQEFLPRAEAWSKGFLDAAAEFALRLEAAPELAGHAEYLENAGKGRWEAKLLAHFIRVAGLKLVQERSAGRVASSLLLKIIKVSKTKPGVVSRHAKKLSELWSGGHAWAAIQEAIQQSSAAKSVPEFQLLVEQACKGDKNACWSLQEFCRNILPGMPSPNGRPMADETGIHVMFGYLLDSFGETAAYTYESLIGNFSDPRTNATRRSLLNPGFSPIYSRRLLTGGTLSTSADVVMAGPKRPRTKS